MRLLTTGLQHSCKIAFLAALTCLSAMAADRIVDRVDPSRTATVKGQIHPLAQPQFDRGAADPAMEVSYATVLLKPAGGLEEFLAEQQTASSANYHRWLTPEEFGARFGLSDSDTGKLVEWLRSQGLQVHDVARGRHWITFSGTAETVGRALHTQFRQYVVKNEKHFANATDPSVPAALADVIAGFAGLNDFHPHPTYVKGPALTGAAPDYTSSSGSHYLAPDDIAAIYAIAPLYGASVPIDGTGQKIAVMGQTAINLPDIATFRTRFGLSANVPLIRLYGNDPGISSTDLPEADIDIEWSGAVARNATIIYVYSSNVFTSAQYAIDQNLAPVMTYSYGSCESELSPAYRAVAQQANAQGITWMASSGDQGAATCDLENVIPQASKGATVTFPADLPEITGVGGTTFNEGSGTYWAASNNGKTLASALSYIPEMAWNDSLADNGMVATGGGASLMYTKPSWQTGPEVPADNARDIPDVSLASSANHDGYQVVTSGAVYIYGGTSVAAPEFAGVVALLNQYLMSTGVIAQAGLGNINPQLYRLAQATTDVFHDITVGDNKVPCLQGSPQCVNGLLGDGSGTGYNLATGLGSIDANNLVTEWNNGTASTTSLTASPMLADLDSTVTLTATVSGGGKLAPTGTVTFIEDQVAIGSAALTAGGSISTATLSIPEVVLAGDTGVVVAMYAGDGVYDGSSGTVTVQVNVPATGSLVVPIVAPNPVYQKSPTSWPFVVTLRNLSGVATTLTGFTVNGTDYSTSIKAFFGATTIRGNSTIAASLTDNPQSVPFNETMVFSGADSSGQTWSRQITVLFLGPPTGQVFYPSIAVSSTPTNVEQNTQAAGSCQWSVQLVVNEQAGFPMQLTKLTAGTSDLSAQIQQVFGTTRLAAWGALRGTVCWASGTAPASETLTVTALSLETGIPVTASATATLAAAAASPAAFTISPATVTMQVADAQHSASASLSLTFSSGSAQWSAAVTPNSKTTNWLSLLQASGTGAAQLKLAASGAGLSPGVYSASVSIQSTGVIPQYIVVPVTFVVAPASATQIGGVANNASFATVFAPGMQAAVFGTELAPQTLIASRLPLPLSQLGVTATVNGNNAPFYYVSPGQLDIQIPYETGSGPAVLAVNNNGQIAWFPLQISTVAPQLYGVWDALGRPATTAQQGQVLLAFTTGEGDLSPTLATGATPASGTAIPKLPSPRQPVALTVGGVPSTPLLFAGVPTGLAGVMQINFTVPANAPLGPQPVVVTVGGIPTNTVTLNITAASTQ
ncbi:MAG: protease pro-enzyme activation domain-containing protein [Bryobacteraceae bacterium]